VTTTLVGEIAWLAWVGNYIGLLSQIENSENKTRKDEPMGLDQHNPTTCCEAETDLIHFAGNSEDNFDLNYYEDQIRLTLKKYSIP
jgi:hypothetical protein